MVASAGRRQHARHHQIVDAVRGIEARAQQPHLIAEACRRAPRRPRPAPAACRRRRDRGPVSTRADPPVGAQHIGRAGMDELVVLVVIGIAIAERRGEPRHGRLVRGGECGCGAERGIAAEMIAPHARGIGRGILRIEADHDQPKLGARRQAGLLQRACGEGHDRPAQGRAGVVGEHQHRRLPDQRRKIEEPAVFVAHHRAGRHRCVGRQRNADIAIGLRRNGGGRPATSPGR